jgi:hypothetical protein
MMFFPADTISVRNELIPAHPGLQLHALPADVLPNIFSRLPGPDLLSLVQVLEHSTDQNRAFVRAWAGQELADLATADGEAVWKRFPSFIRSCADAISHRGWEQFLVDQQKKGEGNARLLQFALLSPGATRASNHLRMATQRGQQLADGVSANRQLTRFCDGASENAWMGVIAGMVIAGRWHHLIEQYRQHGSPEALDRFEQDAAVALCLAQLGDAFRRLPIAHRIDILPSLATDDHASRSGILKGFFQALLSRHLFDILDPLARGPKPNYLAVRPAYFSLLNVLYSGVKYRLPKEKLMTMTIALHVSSMLPDSIDIGPWNHHQPALALCLLITSCLLLSLGDRGPDLAGARTFDKKLTDGGFISKGDLIDLFCHVGMSDGDTPGAVRSWMAAKGRGQSRCACIVI